MGSRPIYKNYFARDFTLALIEIWWRGEVSNPKIWTKEKQPNLPYIVFENIGPTANGYYDPQGIKWCEEKLIEKVEKTGNFNFAEIPFKKIFKKLDPLCRTEPVLNREALVEFLKNVEELWPWFEALWWGWESQLYVKYKDILKEQFERLTKLRDESQHFVPGAEATIRKSLKNIYPELGDLISVLTIEEIINGKIPLKEILDERAKGYYFTDNQLFVGKTKDFIEDKFNIQLEQLELDKEAKEIKGQIAFNGIVKGVVKLVYGPRQINKIEEGDIIVAPMTLPDILPAMKKASAFITDEGGIVCHAAIIAREMKKPCIVGTKIATKVLKDGDLVEVDAERGIVKILKKK